MKDFEVNITNMDARHQSDASMLIVTFFKVSEKYDTIAIPHLSIFLALLHLWAESMFQNPVTITRSKVMQLARINSKTTYHKCIKDFRNAGLIEYDPSFHPQGKVRSPYALPKKVFLLSGLFLLSNKDIF